MSRLDNTKLHHFVPKYLKLVSHAKLNIFTTAKKLLNIFENCFNQIKAIHHIYHSIKKSMDIIEMLQRSTERESESRIAYITHAGSTWALPYPDWYPPFREPVLCWRFQFSGALILTRFVFVIFQFSKSPFMIIVLPIPRLLCACHNAQARARDLCNLSCPKPKQAHRNSKMYLHLYLEARW